MLQFGCPFLYQLYVKTPVAEQPATLTVAVPPALVSVVGLVTIEATQPVGGFGPPPPVTHVSVWIPAVPLSVKLAQLGSDSVIEPALAEEAPAKANAAAKAERRMRKDRVIVFGSGQ